MSYKPANYATTDVDLHLFFVDWVIFIFFAHLFNLVLK